MAIVLVMVGLCVAGLPAVLRRLGRRAAPAEWAQLSFVTLVGAVVLVQVGLVLIAAPTVFRRLGVGALADACDRLVGPLMPLGDTGGWVAAVLAVATASLATTGWIRARGRLAELTIEPYLGEHIERMDHVMVVLASDARIAYSVDVSRPQIVLSQGLIDSLTDEQLDGVIAHELAHLRQDHPKMLLVAAAAAAALAWWPPMKRSHRAFRASIERWADELATGTDATRRRNLSDAIIRISAVARPLPTVTFSLADATAERIRAMDSTSSAAPWTVQAALYLPGAAAAVVALAVVGGWLSQSQTVLAMAGRCPL